MEIFLHKKNLFENFEKNYKQTCSTQKIANASSPGREKLNTWDRRKMCQAGPRWRPNREMAYKMVTTSCTVRKKTQIVCVLLRRNAIILHKVISIFLRFLHHFYTQCFGHVTQVVPLSCHLDMLQVIFVYHFKLLAWMGLIEDVHFCSISNCFDLSLKEWNFASTNQKRYLDLAIVVTRHQFGISALVSQTLFRGETPPGVASRNVGCFLRLLVSLKLGQ